MLISEILKINQPEVYNAFLKIMKSKRKVPSFSDYANLMKHDSFKRKNGAISQRSWGK